jgi:hypothetical protein
MSEQATAPAAEAQTSAPATDAQATSQQGTAPADGSQAQATEASATATAADPAADPAKANDEAAATPAPKAPEQYADFTTPEGIEVSPEFREQFKQLAKELDLTQEQAQKLIDLDAKRALAQAEAAKTQSDAWFAQTQSDKEIGGDNLRANAAVAATALDKFGTPELKTLLQETGLILHPEIVRAFYRAGKAISEDTIVPGSRNTVPKAQRDAASALYPNSTH